MSKQQRDGKSRAKLEHVEAPTCRRVRRHYEPALILSRVHQVHMKVASVHLFGVGNWRSNPVSTDTSWPALPHVCVLLLVLPASAASSKLT